ncbi:unnamed protein product [Merluccius merluccius]
MKAVKLTGGSAALSPARRRGTPCGATRPREPHLFLGAALRRAVAAVRRYEYCGVRLGRANAGLQPDADAAALPRLDLEGVASEEKVQVY